MPVREPPDRARERMRARRLEDGRRRCVTELRTAAAVAGYAAARRLGAYSRYLTDREGRDLVAAETRRTEVLIGELLGPGIQGQHTAHSPASERAVDIPRMDWTRFRLLAEHADAVAKDVRAAGLPPRGHRESLPR